MYNGPFDPLISRSVMKTKDEIKIVLAGVGNPINESDCLESVLNFARRIAEKIVIKNPNKGKIIFKCELPKGSVSSIMKYIITPGTTPKLTISASESSCFPISDFTLSRRATIPSKKSNIQQMPTI